MNTNLLGDIKAAAAAAVATMSTGLGTVLEWIPNDIGKLASLVGVVLSCVLIYAHLLNAKKTRLEIENLRRETGKVKDG